MRQGTEDITTNYSWKLGKKAKRKLISSWSRKNMHWKIIEINAKLLFHVIDKKSTVFSIKIEYKIICNKSSSWTYQATFISNCNCRNERPGKHRWHVLCSTSFVSKQSQVLQRKSAQTPAKADPPTRERVLTWWVNRRIWCVPYSQQTAKEKVFEIVLFGWKCCHFDNNIFQPLDTFHFSLFLFQQRFSFLAKVCYCLEMYSND